MREMEQQNTRQPNDEKWLPKGEINKNTQGIFPWLPTVNNEQQSTRHPIASKQNI